MTCIIDLTYKSIDDIRRFQTRPDSEQDGDDAADLVPEVSLAGDGQDAHGVGVVFGTGKILKWNYIIIKYFFKNIVFDFKARRRER
jgi:hypothetical protein